MKRDGLVTVILAVVCAAPMAGAADCPDRTGHWPYGPTYGVALYGEHVVYGVGTTLRIADVSTPDSPVPVGELKLENFVRGIDVSGTTAFVAASERGLVAVDLTDVANPTVADVVSDIDLAVNVTVDGSTAWVAGRRSGLVAIDVGDPTDLQLLSVSDDESISSWDVAVVADLAFVVSYGPGLHIFDISDPEAPEVLGSLELDHATGIDVAGDYAYIADQFEAVQVVDVSDPSAPELVATIDEGWSYYYNTLVADGLLLVAQRSYGLHVFDLADPSAPTHLDHFTTNGFAHDVTYRDGTAFVADERGGVAIIDLSSPDDPAHLAALEGFRTAGELAVAGSLAAVEAYGDLYVLDISDPTMPTLLATHAPPGFIDDLALDGTHAYLTLADQALWIVDLADPAHPQKAGELEIDSVERVGLGNGFAVVVGDDLLTVVDVTDPTEPTELGRLEMDISPSGLMLVGTTAYVMEYGVGLHVIDCSTPTAPQQTQLLEKTGVSHSIDAANATLFVGNGNNIIEIFDISNPLDPVELGVVEGMGYLSGIGASGNLLGVATIYTGFHVVDVTDPSNPTELGSHPMAGISEADAESVGNLVVVSEEKAGLEIFSLASCAGQPPTADFTWTPAIPQTDQSVQLTDTSTGTISAWQWSFGDTGDSSAQHPTHTWTAAGSYEVTLTVSGPVGSDSVTRTVVVSGGSSESPPITASHDFTYVISASAHIGGTAGTNWVTDALLHNPGASDATAHLYFMKRDDDNTLATGHAVVVLAGSSVELADIVLSLFGENDAGGAILVGADRELCVTSRTYNDVPGGTYGQFIPGQPLDDATGGALLIQLTRNDDYRTNIGVANPSGEELEVGVQLMTADGDQLGQWLWLDVPPYGSVQEHDIFGADVEDGMARLWSSEKSEFFTYASVVDNDTGDPVLILDAPISNELWLPATANIGGYEGTDWRTNLEIYNAGDEQITCTVELLESDQSNLSPQSATMTVDAANSLRVEDALDDLFGYSGTAALRISMAPDPGVVTSRTYNWTNDGTYGQYIPGHSAGSAVSYGETARLVQLHQSTNDETGFRTNIGLVNRTDAWIDVDVALYDADGGLLGQPITERLDPYEHRQLNKIFREVTGSPVSNGTAVVSTTTEVGSFLAYASVIDNASGDPVFMPVQ